MALLDLPLVLVSDVIALLVLTEKIEDILRLRGVSTIFDAEVTKYICKYRLHNVLELWSNRNDFVWRPEALESRLAFESFNTNVDVQSEPKKTIIAVTDHLTCEMEIDDQPGSRIDVFKAAFTLAHKRYGFRCLLKRLFGHEANTQKPLDGAEREIDIEVSSYLVGIALGRNDTWPSDLANKVDANAATSHFGSPMDVAVCFGTCGLIRQLIRDGVRRKNWNNRRHHLSRAVSNGRKDVVLLLLNPKYKLRTSGTIYRQAIETAAGKRDLDIVWILVEHHRNRCRALRNRTLFWWACRWGWNDLLQEIIATGISPNDIRGTDVENYETEDIPLAAAAAEGRCSTVRLLLSNGAAVKKYGSCAFAVAAAKGRFEVLELMLDQKCVNIAHASWALCDTAEAGRIDVFKFLLSCGFKYELPYGVRLPSSPVPAAVQANQVEMVRWLSRQFNLDMNKYPEPGSYYGIPMIDAIRFGYPDMVDLLFQLGADPLDASTVDLWANNGESYETKAGRERLSEKSAEGKAKAIDVHNLLAEELQRRKPATQLGESS